MPGSMRAGRRWSPLRVRSASGAPPRVEPVGMGGVQIVWLKRDLREHDHAPLAEASRAGPVLGLYVYEPSVWGAPDADATHLAFVDAALLELRRRWAARGGVVLLRVGEMPEVLDRLSIVLVRAGLGGVAGLWSHEETGNAITYARDRRVAAWCRERGVRWEERAQNGVVRRLRDRDGWAAQWAARMSRPETPPPERIPAPALGPAGIEPGEPPGCGALGMTPRTAPGAQIGGESHGLGALGSFLSERGVGYQKAMSSPVEGWDACSRISPYLAWGCLSIRRAHRAAEERGRELGELIARGAGVDRRWFASLRSFGSRLRWHCHFMQKLESEPEIEFRNFNRAYDGLREDFFATPEAARRFAAWRDGRTGYPMIDACMRALHSTGWINFRMRAMLASFASYHLWLHWREPSVFLATRFLDYEPGIHYSQFQMQSGVTGINTVRIYSPAKQAKDQDPAGVFIRRWVPELARVPDEHLPEPHRMPPLLQMMVGCRIGEDYPEPIVDHRAAYAAAREAIFRLRAGGEARREARRVYLKHGSRKRPADRRADRGV